MDVLMPRGLDEGLEMKAERPDVVPIAGGTDLMVAVNFGRLRPDAFLDVAGLCLVLDERRREVRVALGSAGPTILRAPEAEAFAAGAIEAAGAWDDPAATVPEQAVREFGEMVGAAALPIDDVRGSAA